MAVVEGQTVHAGDKLVSLDSRLAEAICCVPRPCLSQKQANLAKLRRGYLPEEIDQRPTNPPRLPRPTSTRSAPSCRHCENCSNRQEISNVQYEMKQKALEAAQATLASADANLKLMEHGTRPEMIAEAQAQVDVAAADVKAAQLAVDWCTIRSPIDGTVVQLSARQGQFFDRAVPLATITDLSEVFAKLRIPSDALANVHVGTPVEVRVTAFPGEVFAGKVVAPQRRGRSAERRSHHVCRREESRRSAEARTCVVVPKFGCRRLPTRWRCRSRPSPIMMEVPL